MRPGTPAPRGRSAFPGERIGHPRTRVRVEPGRRMRSAFRDARTPSSSSVARGRRGTWLSRSSSARADAVQPTRVASRFEGCVDGSRSGVAAVSGFAQFCANRLVRRETEGVPEVFFSAVEGRAEYRLRARHDRPAVMRRTGARRGCCGKSLVLRIRLRGITRRRRRRADRTACHRCARRQRRAGAPGKKMRAGVDSEKNRD